MSTLDRWLTAQEETPNIPYKFKATKPKAATPTEVDYMEGDLVDFAKKIQQNQQEIKDIKADAKVITDKAKTEAAALATERGQFAKTKEITELVSVVGEGLDKFDADADVVFRQINGMVVTLQRLRTERVREIGAEAQLQFVLDALKEADSKMSQSIKMRHHHFKDKMREVQSIAENYISVFPKPKKVKNLKAQVDEYNTLVSYVSSGVQELSGMLHEMRDISNMLSEAENLLTQIGV